MKIVIADSNELALLGLQTVLNQVDTIELIGQVETSEALIKLTERTSYDQLVIDYTSENFSIDVVPKVLYLQPDIDVIAITPEQSAVTLINALKSGVKSYVKKDCSLSEIKDAVIETEKGNNFFCGKILNTIRKADINIEDYDLDEFTCEPIDLSTREIEVIKLIAEGLTNIQIADELFLSAHTVNTHRKNIMAKLGIKNTAGIVIYAVKMNLISPKKFLFASNDHQD